MKGEWRSSERRALPEPLGGESASGAGFEVGFEGGCLFPGAEGGVVHELPGAEFRGVRGAAFVVLSEAGFEKRDWSCCVYSKCLFENEKPEPLFR